MILSCNSCSKKFVVPDSAIIAAGRMVQCGSCGNKWKQFPISLDKSRPTKKIKTIKQVTETKIPKPRKKRSSGKKREIDLYSPEYLAKKHGIKLKEDNNIQIKEKKVSFGFYNTFLLFIIIIIAFSKGIYFAQDVIIQKLPFTEFYLEIFFESIINLFEIWKNLILSY